MRKGEQKKREGIVCDAVIWLRNVLLICGVTTYTLADSSLDLVQISGNNLTRARNIVATTYQPPRAILIEEFVTSHKLPENVAKPLEDDDEYTDEKKVVLKNNKHFKKIIQKYEDNEKKMAIFEPVRRFTAAENDDLDILTAKRQARVEPENFSNTEKVLQEEGIKKIDFNRLSSKQDEVIPRIYASAEYPTTMLPILTTPHEAHNKNNPFDFVPVNIIREDSKDDFERFSDANFGDLSDVSLIPAGTNSRIQVKKGPNGKDYEYEYVYYYYDEEDENKASTAGSAVTNSYDIPSKTISVPRRGSNTNNRREYNAMEKSSTIESNNNEVIPNRSGNRGRQLVETEVVSEERLPANTRFPPRSRSNHNTGTTEPSRTRNNRLRPNLDLVDSSSFRTHQEGPEFPQTLPKGPIRFLGVTPNEDLEEKLLIKTRKPQKIQESVPVEEVIEDALLPTRRRSMLETRVELNKGQTILFNESDKEESTPEKIVNKHGFLENKTQDSNKTSPVLSIANNPTTEYPSIMDKVALDLYAFLQQGQNNLIDVSSSETGDNTMLPDEITTDLITTTDLTDTTIVTTMPTTTSTTTEPTTTTTTTTEPSTTTSQVTIGRGKFRRPGIGGSAISRNRSKPNGNTSTTTEVSTSELIQKTRGRFGSSSFNSSGFKRPRPIGNHKVIEEDIMQKETSSLVNMEKLSNSRGRFRVPSGSKTDISATTLTPSNSGTMMSNSTRPTFNKLNINRRRGRPTTVTPDNEELQEATHSEIGQTAAQIALETVTSVPKSVVRTRPSSTPTIKSAIRPGLRVSLRQKPGQISTTLAPETSETSVEEPTGEGTEEETHEASIETSLPQARTTMPNPLNKLRNRNRLQVQPKTTTKSPSLLPAIRRSPLLPRRKVTEILPAIQSNQEDFASVEEEAMSTGEIELISTETSTATSTKYEEAHGLSLLMPRRKITARRPGQINRE